MAGTVKWRFEYTAGDGSIVVINVTATLQADGSIKVDFGLDEASADADLLRIGFDFFDDGGEFDTNPGQSQQFAIAPEGDGFDYIEDLGTFAGNDDDYTEGSITFTAEQLIDFGFVEKGEDGKPILDEDGNEIPLTEAALMEAFAETVIGFRAQSVGDDREDSLKIVQTGEYHPPEDEEPGDFFPELSQGISHVLLVFDIAAGKDGYYTVKIDEFPGAEDEVFDLDDHIEDIIAWLIECDPVITAENAGTLMGALIKSGANEQSKFYAYGDNDSNGTEVDEVPEGWAVSANPRNANAAWRGEIEASYDFADIYNEECDCIC